jgi:protein SCO1
MKARELQNWVLSATFGLAALCAQGALAQNLSDDYLPPALEGVGVEEHADTTLPLGLELTNQHGNKVRLGDYFKAGRPVLLTLNYYDCPMLCTIMLNGLVDGLREVPLMPGEDYTVVTVSFDPTESASLARSKQQVYAQYWGEPAARDGWVLNVASRAAIEELTSAVGFKYKWDEATQQYAHPAVAIFCTPDGKISRYLYGVQYDPETLRLTLVEAANGKIGTPVDQIILSCFQYDPAKGSYVPVAMNLMRASGVVIMLVLLILLTTLWRAERKRRDAEKGKPLMENHV